MTMRCIVASILVLAILAVDLTSASTRHKPGHCGICRKSVKGFLDAFDRTLTGNFGGGNPNWEKRKLGNYLTSETRFEDITDHMCDRPDCYEFLEEHEDDFLEWFKKKQSKIRTIEDEFCIKQYKYCCPTGTYGPKCSQCPKLKEEVCGGKVKGRCDGDGTRSGSGKCECNPGYAGELCSSKCEDGYFKDGEDEGADLKCTECDKSCDKCERPGADACIGCKSGFLLNETSGLCDDVDECKNKPCGARQYCDNKPGSFSCSDCDAACATCTGEGATGCSTCSDGYRFDGSATCVDINECQETPGICSDPALPLCYNRPGSYRCQRPNTKDTYRDEEYEKLMKHAVYHKDL